MSHDNSSKQNGCHLLIFKTKWQSLANIQDKMAVIS